MSRLTGSDVLGLFEAYQTVYVPQELTEEQVWEEVENWVNSLLEEGYDLSDCTWGEMYEAYINEASDLDIGIGRKVLQDVRDREAARATKPATPKGEVVNLPKVKGAITGGDVTLNKGYPSQLGGKKGEVTYQKNKSGVITRKFREFGSEANPPSAAQARKDEADPRRNSAAGSPSPRPAPPAARPSGAAKPAARPAAARPSGAAPAARPAAARPSGAAPAARPAAARPSGAAPAARPAAETGPTGKPLVGGIERRTPTRSEMGAAKAYRTPAATTGTLGSATAAASKPAAFSPAPARPSLASQTAELRQMRTKSLERQGKPLESAAVSATAKPTVYQSNSFDPFDVVMGHLLDEGYADTEESALAIMANMSEEWRESIVEQSAIGARAAKVVDDQRQGYHGDSDAINKLQDAASRSMGRLKKGQGPVVTPGLPGV
jgi:hypothetical protein